MDVINAIHDRRSIKYFSTSHRMPDGDIHQLISATMLSPTAFNIQNWRFVIINNPALRSQIRAHAWDQPQITDASLLIALCADLNAWNKSPERYWSHAPENVQEVMIPSIELYYRDKPQIQRDEAMRSCGIAAQSLMLTAKSMGYDSCPMDGFDFAEVGKLIRLPSDHILTMLVAVGKATAEPWPRGGHLLYDDVVLADYFPQQDICTISDTNQIMEFRPGVYRHYKGAHYLAIGLAREDSSNETVVVYTRLYEREGLPLSTRTLSEWNREITVGSQTFPRFVYVGQMND
ncbi:DUF1653 domain-containing protein [Serratia liquefaciens]|jgi:nitroreductase|uniref:DUF1653 domain-containing protein n=1 Tax=Serratia liquefaciens TaxID=614 RepID=UPI00301CCCCE